MWNDKKRIERNEIISRESQESVDKIFFDKIQKDDMNDSERVALIEEYKDYIKVNREYDTEIRNEMYGLGIKKGILLGGIVVSVFSLGIDVILDWIKSIVNDKD